ncbi:peptidoglycan DD-metalloendopeptidase family protein [Streptomyces varsoviensis]|uniref:murein hydrolase activator EnvC family protein n=1 Tax=Streptomyces varsoviensis TaxID=67373 RepID=UPI0033F7CDD1
MRRPTTTATTALLCVLLTLYAPALSHAAVPVPAQVGAIAEAGAAPTPHPPRPGAHAGGRAEADGPQAGGSQAGGPAPGASPADAPARAWPVTGNGGAPRPLVVRAWEPPPAPWAAGHRGVDLAARSGQAVRAAGAGKVSFAGKVAGRGVLSIELSGTGSPPLRTTYEPVRATVHAGDRVAAGQPVGALLPGPSHCGATACLHWGLLRGHRYLDPLSLLPPDMLGSGHSRLLPIFGIPLGAPAPPPAPLPAHTSERLQPAGWTDATSPAHAITAAALITAAACAYRILRPTQRPQRRRAPATSDPRKHHQQPRGDERREWRAGPRDSRHSQPSTGTADR